MNFSLLFSTVQLFKIISSGHSSGFKIFWPLLAWRHFSHVQFHRSHIAEISYLISKKGLKSKTLHRTRGPRAEVPRLYEIRPFSIIFELIGSEILACVLSNETTERFLETSRFCPCRPSSPNAFWWHLVDWLFSARRKIPFIIEFLTICLRSESVFCLCFSIMRKPALLLKFI